MSSKYTDDHEPLDDRELTRAEMLRESRRARRKQAVEIVCPTLAEYVEPIELAELMELTGMQAVALSNVLDTSPSLIRVEHDTRALTRADGAVSTHRKYVSLTSQGRLLFNEVRGIVPTKESSRNDYRQVHANA